MGNCCLKNKFVTVPLKQKCIIVPLKKVTVTYPSVKFPDFRFSENPANKKKQFECICALVTSSLLLALHA